MPIFEVEVGGRMRSISVDGIGGVGPEGGAFQLVVDGTPHRVSARPTDLGLSVIFDDTGRSVDVAITERAGGEWVLQLPRITISALVDGRRVDRGRPGAVSAEGEQRVLAPMPGRVVRILVKAGDEVALRQGLIVVEAMKMENELVSPKAGRVKDVAVTEGTSVEAGRVLLTIE